MRKSQLYVALNEQQKDQYFKYCNELKKKRSTNRLGGNDNKHTDTKWRTNY